jgi:hypothetical protein
VTKIEEDGSSTRSETTTYHLPNAQQFREDQLADVVTDQERAARVKRVKPIYGGMGLFFGALVSWLQARAPKRDNNPEEVASANGSAGSVV